MSRKERFDRVREVMVKTFGLEADQIIPGARLVEDLRLDSLDWVELIVVLERETGRGIPEIELKTIRTVGDILDLVDRRQVASS